ncbi:ALS2 C-terminal-like protein isoform X1 [Anomalospiza imberbis]|uniref:ALS2 C-terminal-like protein isoform X1 n=2 Tax=Anomalospiza imberbis TaxID=187417 RepID=UPI00358F113D
METGNAVVHLGRKEFQEFRFLPFGIWAGKEQKPGIFPFPFPWIRIPADPKAMSTAGISGILGSLLQVEENFSSCLARIDTLILKPLLQAEPQDPKEKENFQLLVLLNDRFQTLWNFTEENSRILRGKSQLENPGCIQDFYILWKGELFLSLYIQYFVTFANFVVVQGFEQAAKSKSEAWKLHKAVLKEFIRDFTSESSLGLALHSVLHKPFREHIQSYLRLLSQLQEQLQEGSERDVVAAVAQEFGKLETFIGQVLDEAGFTKELWKSLGYKFTDMLCVPERRLLEDSRNLPIASGTSRSERLLLFDDVLVLIQGNSFQSFDLKLVWVDENCGEKSAPGLYSLRITTPEETFVLSTKDPQMKAVWRWKLEQAVRQALNGKRDFPLWGRSREGSEAPSRRFFTYVFRMEGRLRGATYEGEWLGGKPHGKGTLKWRDGRNHVGDFQEGLEHGFGICLVPRRSEDRYDCYKCHWYQGKMRGYGICEYGNDLVYKGYFKDNVRQGFGILENFSAEHPFKYTGHWENDKKNGYGVWEDKERGERYIGMWLDDHRQGEGIVVTQSGLCYQRTFHADKMVGSGILLLEDDSVYEGNFTEDLTFVGKGKLSMANGFVLEGTFSSRGGRGLSTHGVLSTATEPERPPATAQLGLKEFPVEKRWTGIFEQFLEFLHSGCKEEMEESFTGFHIQTSKELRKSQEYLFCQRGAEEISWKIEEILEELVQHQEPELLQSYLEKALESSLHPLGKLLRALTVAFQATYSGIGANRHLLAMAQEEVKFYSKKIWEFYQGLLRLALERKGCAPSEDADPSLRKGSSLVLPLILPGFYPELSMLYMLQHQREDELYCQGIVELSLFPDIQLLEFLDVQKHLWPLKDLTLTSNQRRSLIKDKCFLSATECLQKLITTVDPREKLEILRKTYEELERTVSRLLDADYRLPMDDLLPLLMFVVSRAKIQHLGAEIHLIRDLMDPTNQGGMLDFLLTALESCYEHIQRIRLQPKENSHSS